MPALLAHAEALERSPAFDPAPTAAEEQVLLDLFAAGRYEEAARCARSLTQRFPAHLFAWKVLAAALFADGQTEEALVLYEGLLAPLAHDWQFLNNFGNALKTVNRLDDARMRYRQARALAPEQVEPVYNLGLACIDAGDFDAARAALEASLKLSPRHGLAHLNLANLHNLCGRLAEAEEHYLAAHAILPPEAKLLNNLGQLYSKLRRYEEAEHAFREAIRLDPDYATPVSNLSELMATHGYGAEAELLLRHAVRLDPTHAQAHSNLLFTLMHRENVTSASLAQEHRRFAERFEAPIGLAQPTYNNGRDPARRLRIGVVSADLRSHPLMRYLPHVLEELAHREDVELWAYCNNPQQDEQTLCYRKMFAHWRDVFHLSDASLADRLRADGLDIILELSGHTGHNRLLTLARRPAPLQISWMGYPGSTGMAAIDYCIVDRYLVPEAHEAHYTERLLHLPAATTFTPHPSSPAVSELPAAQAGVFTFACLARTNKLNRPLIRTWATILRRTQDTRLMLATMPDGRPPELVLRWFVEEGLGLSELKQRLVFVHYRNVEEQLALHEQIDLALDTFPYTGSTGSSHSLWMGVPTLSLAGETTAGRMGAALALHVGLPELIAESPEDYVSRAIGWTIRLDDLATIRREARTRFAASALQQHGQLTEALMLRLRHAWAQYCSP